MPEYADSREHLLDELQRIDLLIQQQVSRFRSNGRDPADAFRGLHISDQDVDVLLAGSSLPRDIAGRTAPSDGKGRGQLFRRLGRSTNVKHDTAPVAIHPEISSPIASQLQKMEADIAERKAASQAAGIELRLENLITRFGLGNFERDALLICLAPELDLKYERLYAYLHDDVTCKRPTVDLVLNLLFPIYGDKLMSRAAFAHYAQLIHYHLLEIAGEPVENPSPLLSRTLKVDDRIVDYLLGGDSPDVRLNTFVHWAKPDAAWDDLGLPETSKERLLQLADWYSTNVNDQAPKSLILFLHGPEGAGKQAVAQALCCEIGTWLAVVNLPALLQDRLNLETAIRLVMREAVLQQAPLYWEGFDALLQEDERARKCRTLLLTHLETLTGLTFVSGETSWEPAGALQSRFFLCVECSIPPYPIRRTLWESQLGDQAAEPLDLHTLANQFLFGADLIRGAVMAARNRALWRNPGDRKINMADLLAACRALSHHKLGSLAQHIDPIYGWDDIVLPPDQLALLREICYAVRYRPIVYTEWGFERKLSQGKGVNALFTGPSGTGKTMASEVIARDLGLDLYKIDLSSVVSKYIGETEKNLEHIFREARTSNAILFFDEADALFGKRSEVKDSHDRYANIEIAYLLQKIEEYEGIVILATNLKKNMDEAFVRRIQFTVEFPFPEETDRLRIWQKIWPVETPLSSDVDLDFMARQFKLAGGNIKNIALAAAFLAAADSRSVTMPNLIQATKREFQKMGKLCSQTEFGPYFHLIKS
jgi:SpoVK/Ycf46/Vps4 family AAA+-type ATPase